MMIPLIRLRNPPKMTRNKRGLTYPRNLIISSEHAAIKEAEVINAAGARSGEAQAPHWPKTSSFGWPNVHLVKSKNHHRPSNHITNQAGFATNTPCFEKMLLEPASSLSSSHRRRARSRSLPRRSVVFVWAGTTWVREGDGIKLSFGTKTYFHQLMTTAKTWERNIFLKIFTIFCLFWSIYVI